MKTPLTTADVQRYFLDGVWLNEGNYTEQRERGEAFIDWLNERDASVWQAGYDEGNDDGYYKALQQGREGY